MNKLKISETKGFKITELLLSAILWFTLMYQGVKLI